jgi:hypothetical protein
MEYLRCLMLLAPVSLVSAQIMHQPPRTGTARPSARDTGFNLA